MATAGDYIDGSLFSTYNPGVFQLLSCAIAPKLTYHSMDVTNGAKITFTTISKAQMSEYEKRFDSTRSLLDLGDYSECGAVHIFRAGPN